MPLVTFQPSGIRVEVKAGTTLFAAALAAGLPVASSCSADFVCGKCGMRVLSGGQGLSPQTDEERRLLQRENRPLTERISCKTQVLGDCTVTTGYW